MRLREKILWWVIGFALAWVLYLIGRLAFNGWMDSQL